MSSGKSKRLAVDIEMEVTKASSDESLLVDIEMGVTKASSDESLLAKWMVDTEARAKNTNMLSEEEQLWKTTTVYKVPAFARELNPKAFTPEFVSFGPFHHDNPELKGMEAHKERAFVHFIKRANKPLQNIVHEIAIIITKLRDVYCCLDNRWKTEDDAFLKMMIVDGCFMLEVLQFSVDSGRGYLDTDPYFSRHGVDHKWPYIRRDMLLIENQLPLFLLRALLPFQALDPRDEQDIDGYINRLVLNFVAGNEDTTVNTTLGLHALDLYRQSLLSPELEQPKNQSKKPATATSSSTAPTVIRCAVELHEAGVSFKKSKTKKLNDVQFNSKTGKFRLPFLMVDDATECSMLNIIAFEHLHVNVNHQVTSYVCIMDEIIDSANDVSLLHDKGIILNSLGSYEAVAGLFNKITKEVTVDPDSSLKHVRGDIFEYCRKKRNKWRANLYHTYFKSPWSALSLAGALLVIGLTIIQTVYTVLR